MSAGLFRNTLQERVIWGRDAAEALASEVAALGARCVFLVTNRSLGGKDGLAATLARSLGERHAGTFAAVSQHAPRDDIIAGAAQARAAGADLLVAVGGGSVIDAAKVMLHCLWNGIERGEELIAFRSTADSSRFPQGMAGAIRLIAIPTTYSGAEFGANGSMIDPVKRTKGAFRHPLMMPLSVILDPAATLDTPLDLLLSTGVKAIDHTVERLCCPAANPFSNALSAEALSVLTRCLPAIQDDPSDLAPRSEGQVAMWISILAGASGVGTGLSHAIGRTLGAVCGVSHGVTSCLCLPATMRWTARTNAKGLDRVSAAMGRPGADAADLIDDLIASLDLPGRLSEAGVRRDDLPLVAEGTMRDPLLGNNPRAATSAADIMEILDLAW